MLFNSLRSIALRFVAVWAPAISFLFTTPAQAQPTVRYVDHAATGSNNGQSWPNAWTSLETALQAVHADLSTEYEIWVAKGTYTPSSTYGGGGARTKTFWIWRTDLKILGGFVSGDNDLSDRHPHLNITTINADLGGDGRAYHGMIIETRAAGLFEPPFPTADRELQIDGFHFTNGLADGSGQHAHGGGLLIKYAAPVIQNCVFHDNDGTYGGGAHADGLSGAVDGLIEAEPTFRACFFTGNTATNEAGGFCNQYGEPEFLNCVFSGNIASGSGAKGGALYNYTQGTGNSTMTVLNCSFSKNRAGQIDGSGISTNGEGGAIWNNATLTLYNSILWGNQAYTDPQIRLGSTYDAQYTNTQGGALTGTGNNSSDPLFQSPLGPDGTVGTLDDNLRLSCSSPSIDQGVKIVPDDDYDIDDDTTLSEEAPTQARRVRTLQSDADQGAYETAASDGCSADVNNDNMVNVTDLLAVIGQWGTCTNPISACSADVAPNCGGDGVINVTDLLAVIGQWGPCPGFSGDPGEIPDLESCYEACEEFDGQDWIDCMEECLGGS